jgi:hypothetical protein
MTLDQAKERQLGAILGVDVNKHSLLMGKDEKTPFTGLSIALGSFLVLCINIRGTRLHRWGQHPGRISKRCRRGLLRS